jgi:outer membrane protein, multidrug efflux system
MRQRSPAPTVSRAFRLVRAVVGLCLIPGLSACLLGPDKIELGVDIPEKYTASTGRPDAALPTLDWWRSFRSRELTRLMEDAQTANQDIAAAVARVLQADASARVANAALLPVVNLNDTATRTKPAVSSSSTTVTGASVRSIYNLNFNASYEIDFWGKNRAALASAEETAVASRFDRDVVTLTALASVGNAYLQVLGAQDRLRIARDNLAAANRIFGIIKEREAVGTTSQLEVKQQESVVATQRAAIPPLDIILKQNIAALAVLAGRPPESYSVSGGSLNSLTVPRVTPGLPSEILNQRPDIRRAEAQLASRNYSVQSARAAFFPTISLTGTNGWQSSALASLFTPGAWYYSMAAGLVQPVFDGGRLFGQLDLAEAQRDEALATYRAAVLGAFRDIEQALIALQQQTLRERLQADVVRTAREAFQISETRLREGTTDIVTVLATQQTLFQGQDTLAQIRLARLLAAISLYQALGGGWPPLVAGQPS